MIVKITAILLGSLAIAAMAFVIWALCVIAELKDIYEKEKPTPASKQ